MSALRSVVLAGALMSLASTASAQGIRFGVGGGPTFSLEDGGVLIFTRWLLWASEVARTSRLAFG
jgi:hypothetical protein